MNLLLTIVKVNNDACFCKFDKNVIRFCCCTTYLSFSAQKFFYVSVEIAWVSCSVTRQKFALFQSNCNICHYRTRASLLQFLYVSKTVSSILQKKDLFWSIFIPIYGIICTHRRWNISGKFRVYFLGHESTLNPILSFPFLSANFINWKASSRTFAK